MKNIIYCIALVLISFNSIGQVEWNDEYRSIYVNSCVEKAKESISEEMAMQYCLCTAEKLEAKYPDVTQVNNLGQEEMMVVVNECISIITGTTATTTTTVENKTYKGATKWSQITFDAYMNSCIQNAKESMGEARAEEYCSCTAGKLQKKYPDETKLGNITQEEIEKVAKKCLK